MEVELHPAYIWDCDNCGRENVVRPMPAFLDRDDEEEMREELGVDPSEQGVFLEVPGVVTCKFCNACYESVPPIEME